MSVFIYFILMIQIPFSIAHFSIALFLGGVDRSVGFEGDPKEAFVDDVATASIVHVTLNSINAVCDFNCNPC